MLKTLDECFDWLYVDFNFEIKYDLSRIKKALNHLNNPINYKCIHVAGSNGKGSTVAYLKSCLVNAGYKVGTFISPYIISFNERITLNNRYISDREFIDLVNKVKYVFDQNKLILTYFEVLTVIAFCFFEEQKVDYAIVETGLGGRIDSTNVIDKEVALITNIGYDHMEVLGDTIEEIAAEKLGIVKDCLITSVDSELKLLFQSYCKKIKAKIKFVDSIENLVIGELSTSFKYKNYQVTLKMLGQHQAKNASLAIECLNYLRENKNLLITNQQILTGLEKTVWPGRLEKINDFIYVDGAHNVAGIKALCKFMETVDKKKNIVFTCLKDKQKKEMIALLDQTFDKIYFTEFKFERSESAQNLYDLSNNKNKELSLDYTEVAAKFKKDEFNIFCGSLYFISIIRDIYKK